MTTASTPSTAGTSTHAAADLHAGIAETNRRFAEAMAAGDAERATAEVYTREARIMPPGAPTITGREAIAQF